MPVNAPFADRSLTVHGQRFHLTEWGPAQGPAVLFLHGVTGHARTWDHEAAALASRFRIFALDQRGHGDTDPPPDGDYSLSALAGDIAAVIDALGLTRVSIVGLSLGGRAAIVYAALHPERMERLMVVDIGPDIAAAGRTRVGSLLAGSPEHFASMEDAIAQARVSNPRYDDALLGERVRHGLRPLPDGGYTWKYDRAIRDGVRNGRWREDLDVWPLWTSVTCPTLIVRGAESDVLSPEIATQMIEARPQARLVEVPDAGHTVPGDQPAQFLELLRTFLDT
ncbi:MAG: alpha/beta hydrolase [Candidatus Rokuibacteriota bacterium]|nr:MAG: alpha/beta hydrolase [Candidatus Rokubacteria bacterium]